MTRCRGSRRTKRCGRNAQLAAEVAVIATMVFVSIFAALPTLAHAAAPPTIAAYDVAPAAATVGDRIMLTIAVDHDDGGTIDGPGFGDAFGGMELVDVATPRDEPRDGRVRTTLSYTLTSFHTGTITIAPLAVNVHDSDTATTLHTDVRIITIASVLAPGDASLRPLKPQLDIPQPAPPAVVPALFVAMFAALTAFGYILHQRIARVRPIPVDVAPAAPEPTPAEIARQRLDAIAAEGLASTDIGEYYARIAAVLRGYLSERFAFPAYAMTRRELERETARAGIDRWPARLAANVLEQCDAAEFASFRPAPERREADLTATYEIIALTTEIPVEQQPEVRPST